MSLLEALRSRLFWWRRAPPPNASEGLQKFLYQWEYLIMQFQQIVVWQNPTTSFLWIVAVNIFFWIGAQMEWRFYGLVFLSLSLAAAAEWARHHGMLEESSRDSSQVQPPAQSNLRILSIQEIHHHTLILQEKAQSCYQGIRRVRVEQPSYFCAGACAFFVFIALIGRVVSGQQLVYSIVMIIFTFPAILARYPQLLLCLPALNSGDVESEEFLPRPSEETIKILSLDESPVTHTSTLMDTGEERSLYPDMSTMPSFEQSLDFLDPDVNIPSPRQVDPDSEGSDLSETQELNFKSKHFNGNGSSSSSDELSKGLRFRGPKQRQSSSDSTDSFEHISKDDL